MNNKFGRICRKYVAFGLMLVMLVVSCAACGGDDKTAKKSATKSSATVEPTKELEPTVTVSPTPAPGELSLSVDELPVIDGALALAPFYESVAAKLLKLPVEEARIFVQCNNTPGAYQNLIDGTVDMIFCALPSDEQIAAAEEAGVEFEYYTILNGGFVFFVNKDNPVDSVTLEQLKGIYSGKITNWKELGGNDEPIVAFQRNEGSGSQSGLYRYVLPKEEVMKAPIDTMIDEMAGVVEKVSSYDNGKGAIAFSYYYYVTNMYYNDQIKLLAVEGIEPNDDTISTGSYPFLNFSQIVIRKGTPKDSMVYKIIEWVQGENGAKIAEENGYVPNRISE